MMEKKGNTKEELTGLLRKRLKLLNAAKQHYEQNPNLAKNVKMANIELVQNDMVSTRKALSGSYGMKDKDFKDLLTSIGQARKIHAGKMRASRVFKLNP